MLRQSYRHVAAAVAGIAVVGFAIVSTAETLTVAVDGARIHVEVDGAVDAPALLLWNGAYCTTHMWDLTIERLSKHFRVVRFDVRGVGLSSPSETEDGYRMEQYAEDVNTVLDGLGIDKTIVWCMAWGSRAGIIYASLHPERVRLLAIYDASVDAADVDAQGKGREEAFKLQEAAGMPVIERPAGWNHHEDPTAARKGIAAIRKFKNQEGQLSKITAPTLVCTGDHDPNLPSSRKIAEKVAKAELIVLENVGHGSILQRPDLTTDVFLDFVKRNGMLPE